MKILGVDDLSVKGRYDVDTGEVRLRHTQPVDEIKRYAKGFREKEEFIRKDAEMRPVLSFTPEAMHQIKQRFGLDVRFPGRMTQEEKAKIYRFMQQEYPLLKLTNKKL